MGSHADVATLARQAADRSLSGTVELHPKGLQGVVKLYFYEGRLYALHGPTCVPEVTRRLVATGAIDETTAERMLVDAGGDDAEVGKAAVREGVLPVERLAALHQEFLLAGFGALSAGGAMKAAFHEHTRTSRYCSLPAPVDSIVATVDARASRTTATWRAVSGDEVFVDRALHAGRGISGLRLPEADAIRAAVAADPHASVDSVATAIGLTRAEAVHLIAQLAEGGEVVVGDIVVRASYVPEALLDPKPAEAAPKHERRHRGWFRHHVADTEALDSDVDADVDASAATADELVDELADEAAAESPQWTTPAAVVGPIELLSVEPETVEPESVDATPSEPESLATEPASVDVVANEIAPDAGTSDAVDVAVSIALADADLADAVDLRVVDANTLAAVRARLDAIVIEIEDLRRLLTDLEAGR